MAFFVGLGLEVEGRTFLEGELLDTVSGIPDSRTEIVMLRPPDGDTGLELSSFVRPEHEPGSQAAMANELGLHNVAFEVDDLQAAVEAGLADVRRRIAPAFRLCRGSFRRQRPAGAGSPVPIVGEPFREGREHGHGRFRPLLQNGV